MRTAEADEANASGPLPTAFAEEIDRLRAEGRLRRIGSRVVYYRSVGSTNDIASALAGEPGHEGTVVVADAQTAGRGRLGRTWFSPADSGLYVSIVAAPGTASTAPARATALVTLAAGVALAEAIEQVTGLRAGIKWPNDLLVRRHKLAGILAEASTIAGSAAPPPRVVLGYGINVGPMAYPPELASVATSLEAELGRPVDRAALFAASLDHFDRRYSDLLDARFDAILDQWRARAFFHRGARVRWMGSSGPRIGITQGIDDWGALLVRGEGRLQRIVAGEVFWDGIRER